MINSSIKIYALYHIYDEMVDEIIYKKIKRIGYFETKEECEPILNYLKHMLDLEIIPNHVLKYLSMK